MLATPNPLVLGQLRRLSNDDGFDLLRAWLRGQREEIVRTLSVSRDQWTVGQSQGAVQLLDELEQLIERSRR